MAFMRREEEAPLPYIVPSSEQFDGNDGKWSTHFVSIGTPPQAFRVLVSTRSGETWVPVPEGCSSTDSANCGDLRGVEAFNSAASSGFQVNQSSTWSPLGIYALGLEEELNYTGNGLYGYDTVALGAYQNMGPSMTQELVTGIADKDYYLGHIGVSILNSSFSSSSDPIPPLFVNLRSQKKIPSLSYGYTAGAYYRLKKVLASLVLGGYDSTRFKPSNYTFNISDQGSSLLSVGVQAITAVNTLQGTTSMTAQGHVSVIDSTVSHLWFPRDVCDAFENAFGLVYDATTDLYLVNDTIHAQLTQLNPKITLRLGNSISDTKNGMEITLPYASFDLQASSPFYQNATNYFPIRRAANDTQYTIGRTLLQEAYIIVDYERGNFSINQAIWNDPMPTAKIVTIASPSDVQPQKSGSGISTGAIVGAAVGGTCLIILIVIAFILLRRRRKRHALELADTSTTTELRPTEMNYHILEHNQKPQELAGSPLAELHSPLPQSGSGKLSPNVALGAPYTPGSEHNSFLSPVELETPPGTLMVHEMDANTYVPSPLETPGVQKYHPANIRGR